MLDAPPAHDAELPAGERGEGDEVLRLGRAGRGWRLAVVLGLAIAYVTGSLVGQDDWWPFGPWRMFATSTAPTGNVTVLALQVTTADRPGWQDSALAPGSIGLNRAEVEGRQPQLRADPLLLRTLAVSHARLHPADAAWTGVRLVRRATVIRDGRPTGALQESTLAQWTAVGGARVTDP